ncbi:hypothetical protein CBR_g50869 [Chara braunii]|uniref:Integrase catalytic domain-containing protein n=1 Tax=Chara braunii TaxID=69332 RepID=A0A388M7N9_CHABU|nr:hypothetical protein CBR_g50869 [Chara braunii]|eukprot:GBG90525.1 hypothetical protein CBR_g50869 [Chara braunii]
MDTLVASKNGKRHIFVIVDRFTKYARLIAMSETARTEHAIKLFMDNWVRDFGLSKTIVSDRDVRFTSEMWKKAAEQMRNQLQMTSGNYPEANGQAEQMNRVVQHLLRHYINPSQDDWDEKLPLIASLYNSVVHKTADASPNQLHLGWKPRSALDFLLPENRTAATLGTIEFGVQYEKLLQQTVEHIKKSQVAMIASENKHRRQSTFQVGERVWVTKDFDTDLAERKYPVRYLECTNVVMCQELVRYNRLLAVVRQSLTDMVRAVKGEFLMSEEFESLAGSIFNSHVPKSWMAKSYPSCKPLGAYFSDLIQRLQYFKDWLDRGPPIRALRSHSQACSAEAGDGDGGPWVSGMHTVGSQRVM